MDTDKKVIASVELVLIIPAVLFLAAVVLRHVPMPEFEFAQNARRIVAWYAARRWTLWVLLIGMPLIALVNGCVVLLRSSTSAVARGQAARAFFAVVCDSTSARIIAAATVAAAIILAIVAFHMITTT